MNDQPVQQEQELIALQDEAISLGMEESKARSFTDSSTLQITVDTLKSVRTQQVVAAPAITVDPVASPAEDKRIEKQWKNKAEQMHDLLEKQPKVRILVPLEGQEKKGVVRIDTDSNGRKVYVHVSGAVQPVILNGYKTLIPKGDYDEVPEQVAKTIQDKHNQTSAAGANYLIDRTDPETGRRIGDQL